MAQEKYYYMCRLELQTPTGVIQTVTWIPEEGAEVGKTMRIKPHYNSEWEPDRWTCIGVGARKTETQVKRRMAADRQYVRNTDI